MASIIVLNGPNLNMMGIREPSLYGLCTLQEIQSKMEELALGLGHQLQFFQTNSETKIIEHIHQSAINLDNFIIINPAAFTHTSIAIRDALLASKIAFIEVHLSNVYAREPFRKHSYFSDIAEGVISGLGATGYELALQAADQILATRDK